MDNNDPFHEAFPWASAMDRRDEFAKAALHAMLLARGMKQTSDPLESLAEAAAIVADMLVEQLDENADGE